MHGIQISPQSAPDPHSSQADRPICGSWHSLWFGSGLWAEVPRYCTPLRSSAVRNQPLMVVGSSEGQWLSGNYGSEDKGPYAIPLDTAAIERQREWWFAWSPLIKNSGILYELYNADTANGTWQASSGCNLSFCIPMRCAQRDGQAPMRRARLYSPSLVRVMKYKRRDRSRYPIHIK